MRSIRSRLSALILLVPLAAALTVHGQAARPAAPYTLMTAQGRQPLAAFRAGDQDLFRLDDLAALFHLTVREDRGQRALTVTRGNATIVLSLDQGLASIGGRLVSLPSAPVRDGAQWFVPPDFLSRALGLASEMRIEVRKASRLVLVGDIEVPRIVVRQEPAGTGVRISLEVSPRAPYSVQQEPRRLLLKFDAAAIDATLPDSTTPAMVEGFTVIDPATLALSLGPRFGTYRASGVQVDAGSARIVLDLQPAGAEPPPSPNAPPAPAPAQPPAAITAPSQPALRTIVIDPGHGGDELGARGANGAVEKDITLDVARRLKAMIEGRLGIRVLLTREDDRLVPLDDRASIANNNKADLFISVHANASPRRDARGAEVFYLSLDGYGEEARKLAENPDTKMVPTLGGGTRDIQVILWEMAQARHLSESAVFAGMLEETLRPRVELGARPIQQAPFRVLVGANMPAVLLEMGFLTNPEQEAQLVSDDFKTRVVQALYDAIVRYRDRVEGQR